MWREMHRENERSWRGKVRRSCLYIGGKRQVSYKIRVLGALGFFFGIVDLLDWAGPDISRPHPKPRPFHFNIFLSMKFFNQKKAKKKIDVPHFHLCQIGKKTYCVQKVFNFYFNYKITLSSCYFFLVELFS